jgi:glycosyltransferase involved in cell wall biosynthesis
VIERDKAWSVLAHANAELGVGEIARRLYSLLVASGLETEIIGLNASKSRQRSKGLLAVGTQRRFSNVISCVNPDQLALVVSQQGLFKSDIKNHIGYWAWELEDFPVTFNPAFDLVNEVWTFSDYVRAAIQKNTDLRVRSLPIPIPTPMRKTGFERQDFGVSDSGFMVVTSFDYFSDKRRKNPEASILAFMQAFDLNDDSILVVKSINSQHFPKEHQELKKLAAGRPDILFMDDYFDSDKNLALLELADVVLSLHRAEGYGINLADAMARSTVVMATGYSGNLEFMNDSNSVLVPYSMTPVKRYANLDVESMWAEPDVEYAARLLRNLYLDRNMLRELAARGHAHIIEQHSLRVSVEKLKEAFNG